MSNEEIRASIIQDHSQARARLHAKALEAREHCQICTVCGVALTKDKAIIGRGEALCVGREDSCFGWFSGYPWVLFEDGRLTSDLRDYALEVRDAL